MFSFLSRLQRWKHLLLACIVLYVGIIILYEYHYEEVKGIFAPFLSSASLAESNKLSKIIREYNRNKTRPVRDSQTLLPKLRNQNGNRIRIAIGLGITSRKIKKATEDNLHQKFIFFKVFLPSFCHTISRGYSYHFYLGYDSSDKLLAKDTIRRSFVDTFKNMTSHACIRDNATSVHFQFVRCDHKRNPPWAQNDAMLEAYLDGIEYFYRINDDTIMVSANWTEILISALHQFQPLNVGVVGPVQRGKSILTYDFVHRTHVDIFGFYYPRFFTDWWADSWITAVYRPHNMKALSNVRLRHTMQLGQRYGVDRSKREHVDDQIINDRVTLNKYIQCRTHPRSHHNISKVISMSLPSGDAKVTWDAIRNAQLARIFYSDWTLRFYIKTEHCNRTRPVIPSRILATLQDLDADIIRVNNCDIDVDYLSLLALDDVSIDVFLFGQFPLSESDSKVTTSWLHGSEHHCLRISVPNSTDASAFALKPSAIRSLDGLSMEIALKRRDAILNQTGGHHGDMFNFLPEILLHPCLHADTVET